MGDCDQSKQWSNRIPVDELFSSLKLTLRFHKSEIKRTIEECRKHVLTFFWAWMCLSSSFHKQFNWRRITFHTSWHVCKWKTFTFLSNRVFPYVSGCRHIALCAHPGRVSSLPAPGCCPTFSNLLLLIPVEPWLANTHNRCRCCR